MQREFDAQPPDADFLIRDADSSQQQAIATTLRGQNGVISGPPGTGKSQTISNFIAELGHLCLDCHGADVSRKLIAAQLQESFALVREAPLGERPSTGAGRAGDRRAVASSRAAQCTATFRPVAHAI